MNYYYELDERTAKAELERWHLWCMPNCSPAEGGRMCFKTHDDFMANSRRVWLENKNGVEYAGEDISNDDLSTTGKWGENKWIIVGTDEEVYEGVSRDDVEDEESEEFDPAEALEEIEVPVLEGEEMWAQEAIDESMLTEWFPARIKPVHKGTYEIEYEIATWPWPITAHIDWDGNEWQHDREVNTKVKQWRGLKEPA